MAIVSHAAPVPPGFEPVWRDLLEKHVAIYRRLPEDLTLRVEEMMPWFIEKVKWGWEGWEKNLPEKHLHKVCVACEACLLIARRTIHDYEHFHSFTFHHDSLKNEEGETWAGWASHSGTIAQRWESTRGGMEDGEDNYNVTLHEFAHMLDYRNTPSDSVPYFKDGAVEREYKAFMEEEYADICEAWRKKSGKEVIRKYATTDEAEFFTCATEAFFERSEMLQFMRPKLYDWMKRIYGMDPVEWPERVSYAELQRERRQLAGWKQGARWKDADLPDWVGAAGDYNHWRWEAERQRIVEQRERERERERERLRIEQMRRARLQREVEERIRKERERIERRERERFLLNNRTVIVEHPNGMPQLKYKLVDGYREGMMQRWDEDGHLREETEYARGRKHGTVVYYYPNGQKEMEGFHALNRRAGNWQGWHEDGTRSFRSEYREGELHTWQQFGVDGEVRTYGKVKNRFGA